MGQLQAPSEGFLLGWYLGVHIEQAEFKAGWGQLYCTYVLKISSLSQSPSLYSGIKTNTVNCWTNLQNLGWMEGCRFQAYLGVGRGDREAKYLCRYLLQKVAKLKTRRLEDEITDSAGTNILNLSQFTPLISRRGNFLYNITK